MGVEQLYSLIGHIFKIMSNQGYCCHNSWSNNFYYQYKQQHAQMMQWMQQLHLSLEGNSLNTYFSHHSCCRHNCCRHSCCRPCCQESRLPEPYCCCQKETYPSLLAPNDIKYPYTSAQSKQPIVPAEVQDYNEYENEEEAKGEQDEDGSQLTYSAEQSKRVKQNSHRRAKGEQDEDSSQLTYSTEQSKRVKRNSHRRTKNKQAEKSFQLVCSMEESEPVKHNYPRRSKREQVKESFQLSYSTEESEPVKQNYSRRSKIEQAEESSQLSYSTDESELVKLYPKRWYPAKRIHCSGCQNEEKRASPNPSKALRLEREKQVYLYDDKADLITSLETAMAHHFDRLCDLHQPPMWPTEPLCL